MIMAFMGMMTMMIGQTAWAQNPFVQTWFTSDPCTHGARWYDVCLYRT